MNLELLARAIERILSSRYEVEVKVDVQGESKEDGTAGCTAADKGLLICRSS